MARIRAVKKYSLSKRRMGELYNFCLQYNEWKDELKYKTDTLVSPEISDMPRGSNSSDQTASLAMRRMMLSKNCEIIERSAKEAAPDIAEYIIKDVTGEGIFFPYLKCVMGIPYEKSEYYDIRRKFFFILSEKKFQQIL